MIKIISGKYKGRVLARKKGDFRPSTAKTREAIFSMLTSGKYVARDFLSTANILDLFAGTGSVAFEALSRGAQSACLIDNNRHHIIQAQEFAELIQANCEFLCLDATRLPHANRQYNFVFLDPPYHKNMVGRTLTSLVEKNWLTNHAVILVEMDKVEDLIPPKEMAILDTKIYSNSKILVMRYEQI